MIKLQEIEKELFAFLAKQEGIVYAPYLCIAGYATIGIGHVIKLSDNLGAYTGKSVHDFLAKKYKRDANFKYKIDNINSANHGLRQNFAEVNFQTVMNLFETDIDDFYNAVIRLTAPVDDMNKNKLIALISLVYNVGVGAFEKSRCLKNLIGGNKTGFEVEFMDFNKAGGRIVKGLTDRRTRELELFNS